LRVDRTKRGHRGNDEVDPKLPSVAQEFRSAT
jgi:hypothetical protein